MTTPSSTGWRPARVLKQLSGSCAERFYVLRMPLAWSWIMVSTAVAFIWEPICFENKILVILIPRSTVGVGMKDQPYVRHILSQIE